MEGQTFLELARNFPNQHARYHAWGERLWEEKRTMDYLTERKNYFQGEDFHMRQWQQEVHTDLHAQPDRKVTWVGDLVGGAGKSLLAGYMEAVDGAFVVGGGKYADIAHSWRLQSIVVCDFPREMEERVPYGLLEQFKNGRVFSGKYQSKNKLTRPCKILVLANFFPETEKMSKDRWDIREIKKVNNIYEQFAKTVF